MFQSSFTGLKPLHRNQTYWGGFCKFWYLPVERVAVFPRVGGSNQQLIAEPTLIQGASWFGPIIVPNDRLGFTETMKRTAAGPYYEQKVEGIHVGDSVESRVNLENMAYHRYLVVAKVRAGGFFMLIGTTDSPLEWAAEFKSGAGAGDTAGTSFAFTGEHISKAYILPSFAAGQQAPGQGSSGGNSGGQDMSNKKEIIPFENQNELFVPWTPTRLAKFGNFPVVEVWIEDGSNPPFLNMGASIEVDQPPPAFTELKVNLGPAQPKGFVVIT